MDGGPNVLLGKEKRKDIWKQTGEEKKNHNTYVAILWKIKYWKCNRSLSHWTIFQNVVYLAVDTTPYTFVVIWMPHIRVCGIIVIMWNLSWMWGWYKYENEITYVVYIST